MNVELVLKADAIVGESPLWNVEEQRLYWVDITRKKIHRLDPITAKNETFNLPDLITCVAFRKSGGLVCSMRKQFAFFDPATGVYDAFVTLEQDQPNTRFNDGRVDPQGRFWAGTMGTKDWKAPVGNLYRLDHSLKPVCVLDQVVCSNGTGWSPDGRTMYHTESFRQTIFAYDFDGPTGTLTHKRRFAFVDPASGTFPDGLVVDAEGGVWSNHMGVGEVVRYDPAGKVERRVQFPVHRPAGSTFGGPNMTTLFVTSCQETMDAAQLKAFPLSGSVFAVETGIKGMVPTAFIG